MVRKLLIILLFAAPLSLFAQEKYAYVNSQEILNKMPEMGDMEKKIVAKREAIQKNAQDIENEYKQKLQVFQSDTTNVTQSIMQSRYQELQQIEERFKAFMENSETELKQEQENLFLPIQEKLQKAIKDVGDENHYTYIFDGNMLVYKNAKMIDATKLVKNKLGFAN